MKDYVIKKLLLLVPTVLAITFLVFSMMHLIPGDPIGRLLPHGARNWVELALASPVVLWGGLPFFVRFWQSLVNRSPKCGSATGCACARARECRWMASFSRERARSTSPW